MGFLEKVSESGHFSCFPWFLEVSRVSPGIPGASWPPRGGQVLRGRSSAPRTGGSLEGPDYSKGGPPLEARPPWEALMERADLEGGLIINPTDY